MKKGPIIFLSVLVIILSFILGIQYGKRVEVTDKAIEAILQRVPTPTPETAPQDTMIVYKTLKSNRCGFSFVYPSSYEIEITSTHSAQLLDLKRQVIAFSCSPSHKKDLPNNPDTSSEAASLDDAPAAKYILNGDNSVTFVTEHPIRKIPLQLTLTHDVKLLIEKTFQFQE